MPTPPVVLADLHCHSAASFDGEVAPEELVQLAHARGIGVLAVTDHDSIDGALRARDAAPPGLMVIVGQEARTPDGDLIGLFLERAIRSGLSLAETASLIRAQGGLVGLPHPFDAGRPSICVASSAGEQQEIARLVDYVEVHNGRVRAALANADAADFARRFGLPGVAVSDAHRRHEIGWSATGLHGEVGGAVDLLSALREGTTFVVREAPGEAGREASAGRLARLARRFRRV